MKQTRFPNVKEGQPKNDVRDKAIVKNKQMIAKAKNKTLKAEVIDRLTSSETNTRKTNYMHLDGNTI